MPASSNGLVAAFARAYTLSEIFPMHHATVRDAIDDLVGLPDDAYPLVADVSRFGLTVDAELVSDPHGHLRELAQSLHGAGVTQFGMPRGLTRYEAEDFLISLRRVSEASDVSLLDTFAHGRGTPVALSFNGGPLEPVRPESPDQEPDTGTELDGVSVAGATVGDPDDSAPTWHSTGEAQLEPDHGHAADVESEPETDRHNAEGDQGEALGRGDTQEPETATPEPDDAGGMVSMDFGEERAATGLLQEGAEATRVTEIPAAGRTVGPRAVREWVAAGGDTRKRTVEVDADLSDEDTDSYVLHESELDLAGSEEPMAQEDLANPVEAHEAAEAHEAETELDTAVDSDVAVGGDVAVGVVAGVGVDVAEDVAGDVVVDVAEDVEVDVAEDVAVDVDDATGAEAASDDIVLDTMDDGALDTADESELDVASIQAALDDTELDTAREAAPATPAAASEAASDAEDAEDAAAHAPANDESPLAVELSVTDEGEAEAETLYGEDHEQIKTFREALEEGRDAEQVPSVLAAPAAPMEEVELVKSQPPEPPQQALVSRPIAALPREVDSIPIADLAPDPLPEAASAVAVATEDPVLPDDVAQIVEDAELYVHTSAVERSAINQSIIEAAARLRATGQPEAVAEAVERLVSGSDPSEAGPNDLARSLCEADVVDALVDRLGGLRTVEDRVGVVYTFQRLADVLAPALSRALSQVPARAIRRNYMDALFTMDEHAVRVAIPMLDDSRWFIVRNGVDIIGEAGFPDSVGTLTPTLSHPDARVRRATVMAMAKLGGEEAGLELLPTLEDPSSDVREAAAMAVGHLRVMRALRPLLAMLDREKEDEFQQIILRSLGQLKDPGAVPQIEKRATGGLFSKPAQSVRIAAYRALAAIGTPHARQLVLTAVQDRDSNVAAVARSLASQLE